MILTLANADSALKSAYLDVVAKELDYGINPFFAELKKNTNNIVGKDVKKVVNCSLTGGIVAGSETGSIKAGDSSNYKTLTVPLKNIYGTIEISDKAIRASQHDSGAFVNLLNAEMENLLETAKFHFSRMLFGDGSGKLGTVSDCDESTNIVTFHDMAGIKPGMNINFMLPADQGVFGGDYKVRWVNLENKTAYLEGDVMGLMNMAYAVLQGSAGNELTGLGAIFGDGDLYGHSREELSLLRPVKVENAGEITEAKIQKAIDTVEESCGGKINFILCSYGVKRALQNLLSTYKRNVEVMELKGGYKTISYNGIPVVADRFCPEGTMYLLNTNDFSIQQLCDWQWLEGEDGRVIKQVTDKPVYRATLVKYAELLCSRPCGQAVIRGITEM